MVGEVQSSGQRGFCCVMMPLDNEQGLLLQRVITMVTYGQQRISYWWQCGSQTVWAEDLSLTEHMLREICTTMEVENPLERKHHRHKCKHCQWTGPHCNSYWSHSRSEPAAPWLMNELRDVHLEPVRLRRTDWISIWVLQQLVISVTQSAYGRKEQTRLIQSSISWPAGSVANVGFTSVILFWGNHQLLRRN